MHLSIEITFMDTQFFNSNRSNNKTTHKIDRHHEIEMKKKTRQHDRKAFIDY